MNAPASRPSGARDRAANELRRRTLGGFGWMFLSGGGQVILRMVVLAVLARHVTPEEFGIVGAALVVVSFSAVFTEAGMGQALVQRETITERHIRTAFTVQVAAGTLLWVALSLLSNVIAGIFAIPRLATVVPVIMLSLVLRSLSLGDFLLRRSLDFRQVAMVDLTSWVVGNGAVSVVLALMGFGVWAIVAGTVGEALLRTILLWWVRPHRATPMVDVSALRDLVLFGSGYTLGWWANLIARQGDNIVVGRFLGAPALGLYTRAYSLMRQPAMLFGRIVSDVLFPALAAVQNDRPRLQRTYLRGVSLVALLVLPFSVCVALASTEIIQILLGERWLGVRRAFDIMVFGMLFRTSYKLSDSLATALGAVYRRAWRQFVYAVLIVVGALVGRAWGIAGVATGTLVALFANFLLMAHLCLRLVDGQWRRFARAHVPGTLLASAVALPTFAVTATLRSSGASPVIILSAAAACSAVVALIAIRVAPRFRLGGALATCVGDLLRLLRPGSRIRAAVNIVVGAGYGRTGTAPLMEPTS